MAGPYRPVAPITARSDMAHSWRSVAAVIPSSEPEINRGISWQQAACPDTPMTEDASCPSDNPGTVPSEGERTIVERDAVRVMIADEYWCPEIGDPPAAADPNQQIAAREARLRQRMQLRAAEQIGATAESGFAAEATTDDTVYASLACAIGALEAERVGTPYGLVIHVAPRFAPLLPVSVTDVSGVMRTPSGTPVVIQPGYTGRAPESGTATADGWIYATGPLRLFDSPPVVTTGSEFRENEHTVWLRQSVLPDWSCPVVAAAVQTNCEVTA